MTKTKQTQRRQRKSEGDEVVIIVGLGEVGKPLQEVLSSKYCVVGVDLEPVEIEAPCEVMHICYGFKNNAEFVNTTAAYIEKYHPSLTIINSTVAPGTTRAIYRRIASPIVYSPVRGKHIRMNEELLRYVKFVGGIEQGWSQKAARHFETAGVGTKIVSCPEAAELAKLTETTYFGLLIAWAQEVERYCDQLDLNYEEIVSYYSEISYLPSVKYFSGIIGGHCVMPNIRILKTVFRSELLNAIEQSNQQKTERENEVVSDQHSQSTLSS